MTAVEGMKKENGYRGEKRGMTAVEGMKKKKGYRGERGE